jgi:capsule polysaccharide export protein KpsC/LpsZ
MRSLNKFLQLNKEGINTFETDAQGCIYIPEEITVENIFSDIVRYITAKAISDKAKIRVVRLVNGDDSKEKRKISDSFGFNTINVRIKGIRGILNQIKACVKTTLLFFGCKTGEALLQYRIGKIPIGQYIYDKIIREQERNTIDTISILQDFKNIYEGIYLYYNLKNIYRDQAPKFIIMNEMAYFLNIYRVLGQQKGAKVIRASVLLRQEDSNDMYGFIHESYRYMATGKLNVANQMDYNTYVLEYFKKYLQGESELSWIKSIVADQKKTEFNEAINSMQLDAHKKTVFIMAHSLSDAPHSSSKMLFRDYYTALRETIKIASRIDNVNWVLKVHPSYKSYLGTNGRELIDCYGKKNIVLFDERYSNEIVFKLADAIITVQGTIGIEASSLGIPVVVTGKAWYTGFGFTINAFSMERYEKILSGLYKVKRLSNEKRDIARKVFCAYLLGYSESKIDKDKLGKTIFDIISDKSIKNKNETTLQKLCEYMESKSIENSYIYQRSLDFVKKNN